MSVERVERKGGTVWRVRWRDADGAARSRVAGRKSDAVLLDAEIKRRRRVGEVLPARRQDVTLGEFAVEWFDRMAPSVSERTAGQRALAWDTHLLPLLGHVPLRQLSLEHVAMARSAMHEAGLSDATVRSYLSILSSVLARAAEWGRIPASPMKGYRLPSGRRTRVVRPLTADELARLCSGLSERGARVVTILERSGLRPGELRALRREHVQDRLYVMGTKTRRSRTVPIDALLREALGSGGEWVVPASDGGQWTVSGWNNWTQQQFKPAARAAGVSAVPYDLRHTAASRWIAEGVDVLEVARRLGHSPTMTLSTYAHQFAAKPVSE